MRRILGLGSAGTVLIALVFLAFKTADLKPTRSAPAIALATGSVPTVRQAVVQAISLVSGHGLFAQPHRSKKTGAVAVPVIYESVEILGASQPDGSVVVVFSLPVSEGFVKDGRYTTVKLLELRFTKSGVNTTWYSKSAGTILATPFIRGERDDRFCRAIAVVCSTLPNRSRMEFAARVMEEPKRGELSIYVERIPYTPGGHTLYLLSKNMKIIEIGAGA